MAKYRQLFTEFWSDSFVLELTPEEKYFYLYLLSNPKTSQCGIYEISQITIESETGYNRETVEKLIQRFCSYKKILYCYETKELMIINWIKYNMPNNVNVLKCCNKELGKVKNKSFIEILYKKCQEIDLDVEKIFGSLIIKMDLDKSLKNSLIENVNKLSEKSCLEDIREGFFENEERSSVETSNDTVKKEKHQELRRFKINKHITSPLQAPYKSLGSNIEEVISKKKEVINKKEEEEEVINKKNSSDDDLKNIIKAFEENVHAIRPRETEIILDFAEHVTSEVIIMAIDEAVIYNAKTLKYISKILSSWISNGLKTADEVKAYQKKSTNKKNISTRPKYEERELLRL